MASQVGCLVRGPWTHSTNGCELIINILSIQWLFSHMKNNKLTRPWFCTCHDSWAVVTCAKLWPDGIIPVIITAVIIFTRFQWWAHKALVIKVPWGPSGRVVRRCAPYRQQIARLMRPPTGLFPHREPHSAIHIFTPYYQYPYRRTQDTHQPPAGADKQPTISQSGLSAAAFCERSQRRTNICSSQSTTYQNVRNLAAFIQ